MGNLSVMFFAFPILSALESVGGKSPPVVSVTFFRLSDSFRRCFAPHDAQLIKGRLCFDLARQAPSMRPPATRRVLH